MPKKYIGFDIETANPIPKNEEGETLNEYEYELGICCAAAYDYDTGKTKLWPEKMNEEIGKFNSKMSTKEINEMLDWLIEKSKTHKIVTWNGMGFDFRVICSEFEYEQDVAEKIKKLAWNHIDPGFQMFCEKGYMIGLEAASIGMGFGSKQMDGELAPELWKTTLVGQQKVLRYVSSDAKITVQVAKEIEDKKKLNWTTKAGKETFWKPIFHKKKLLKITNCTKLEEPDTSWMTDSKPWTREKFTEWAW